MIIHLVNVGLDAILKGGLTFTSGGPAFLDGFGVLMIHGCPICQNCFDQFFRPLISQPPGICRMGFADVDIDELNFLMVLLINFLETNGPFYIRWSGKAAKD
jgi:hypothetical protein